MNIDVNNAIKSYENSKIPQNKQFSKDDAKLKEQTDAFEAIFLKSMLDIAMSEDTSLFPKEPGREIYQSMYKEQLSQTLSGNFGFSKLLFDYLKDLQK